MADSNAERFDPAMKIKSPAEADAFLEKLIAAHMERWKVPREQAEAMERGNLVVWSRRFDVETQKRVGKLFGKGR